MKAVVVTKLGGDDLLEVRELPDPEPGEGEVVVRLKAAGINPVDAKQRQHGLRGGGELPAVLGCDGAGVVAKLGRGARRFKEGDEVYFCYGGLGGRGGCYAELAPVPEGSLARKPRALSFAEAAAAPLVLLTAWEALHDRLEIAKGSRLLILGGTGGVGHVAIQLAKNAGLQVCVTAGSEEKAAFARSLGAEEVLRYDQVDVVAEAVRWSGEAGVDYLLATVSGPLLGSALDVLRPYGKAASILAPSEPFPWAVMSKKNLGIFLELMLTPQVLKLDSALDHQREILERCAALFDKGKLTIRVAQVLPLDQAREAHRQIETATTMGKIVLEIA